MQESRNLLLSTVINIRDSHVTYPCCRQCYSKLYSDCTQNSWRCYKCDISCRDEDLEYRYRLSLTITDHTTICNVCVFGRMLEPMFGMPASRFTRYYQQLQSNCTDADFILFGALKQTFVGRCYYFGFKMAPSARKRGNCITLQHVIDANRSSYNNKWTQDDREFTGKHDGYVDTVAFQMIPATDECVVTVTDIIREHLRPQISSRLNSTVENEKCDIRQNVSNIDGSVVAVSSSGESGLSDSTRNGTGSFGQSSVQFSCDSFGTDLSTTSSFLNQNSSNRLQNRTEISSCTQRTTQNFVCGNKVIESPSRGEMLQELSPLNGHQMKVDQYSGYELNKNLVNRLSNLSLNECHSHLQNDKRSALQGCEDFNLEKSVECFRGDDRTSQTEFENSSLILDLNDMSLDAEKDVSKGLVCIPCPDISSHMAPKIYETMPESEDIEAYLNSSEFQNSQEVELKGANIKIESDKFKFVSNRRNISKSVNEDVKKESFDLLQNDNSGRSGHIGFYDNRIGENHGRGKNLNTDAFAVTMPESEDIDAYLGETYVELKDDLSQQKSCQSDLQNTTEKTSEINYLNFGIKVPSVYDLKLDKFVMQEENITDVQQGKQTANNDGISVNTNNSLLAENNGSVLDDLFDDSFEEIASQFIADNVIFSNAETMGTCTEVPSCHMYNSQNATGKSESESEKYSNFSPRASENGTDTTELETNSNFTQDSTEKDGHRNTSNGVAGDSFIMDGSADLFGLSVISQENYKHVKEFEHSVEIVCVLNETENLSTCLLSSSNCISSEKEKSQNDHILDETTDVSMNISCRKYNNRYCSSNKICENGLKGDKIVFSNSRKQNLKSVQFARRLSSFKSVQLIDLQMKIRPNSIPVISEKKSCLKEITSRNHVFERGRKLSAIDTTENSVIMNLSVEDLFCSQDLFSPSPVIKVYGKENRKINNNRNSSDRVYSLRVSTPKHVLMPHSSNKLNDGISGSVSLQDSSVKHISPSQSVGKSESRVLFCGSESLFSESFDKHLTCCTNSESSVSCIKDLKTDEGSNNCFDSSSHMVRSEGRKHLNQKTDDYFDSPFLFSQIEDAVHEHRQNIPNSAENIVFQKGDKPPSRFNAENMSFSSKVSDSVKNLKPVLALNYSNKTKNQNVNPLEFSPDLFGDDTTELLPFVPSPKSASAPLPVKRLFQDG